MPENKAINPRVEEAVNRRINEMAHELNLSDEDTVKFRALIKKCLRTADATMSERFDIPESDRVNMSKAEARLWYHLFINQGEQIIKSLEADTSMELQAKFGYAIRHIARMEARDRLQDLGYLVEIRYRDADKYKNPNGPTFKSLLLKYKSESVQGDKLYETLLKASRRTDEATNAQDFTPETRKVLEDFMQKMSALDQKRGAAIEPPKLG